MHTENEITIEVDTTYEELDKILKKGNFEIKEEYIMDDIYMVNKLDKNNKDYLDLLNKCVLIRNLLEKDKSKSMLTYKHKEYGKNNEILNQTKTSCNIEDADKMKMILENLNFEELIEIKDHLYVYANDTDEIAVQRVNGKHLYIEVEQETNYTKDCYASMEDMKKVFAKYKIPMKGEDYFAKKAEVELKERYSESRQHESSII